MAVISLLGKIRRQLNLRATQALKPLGIGPKQALLLREIRSLKSSCPVELARQTQTDPTSTGKILESLIKKSLVKRTADLQDRRSWRVSLTPRGNKVVQELDSIWNGLAEDFCGPLDERKIKSLFTLFLEISTHLDNQLSVLKDTK